MLSGDPLRLVLFSGLVVCLGCSPTVNQPQSSIATSSGSISGTLAPANFEELAQDPSYWTMPAGDYASTRFSQLDDINADNVGRLKVAWTFSTGMVAGHEAAPLVVGSSMFLVTPFPNVVYALDLSRPGAPVKWKYDPAPLGAAKGVACCDVVNRGVAYWNNSIIFNTLDGRTISVDAETGARKWETQLGDINRDQSRRDDHDGAVRRP